MTAIEISKGKEKFFSFPETVNEIAARTVALIVVLLSLTTILLDQKYLLILLAYGFWARVLSDPKNKSSCREEGADCLSKAFR